MNDPGRLVPPEIAASTRSYKRVGVAFGDRFFMLLFVGLVWIGPAFFDFRFVYALLLWDALVVLAWFADLAQLPKPQQLLVRRTWRAPAALSIESEVELDSRELLFQKHLRHAHRHGSAATAQRASHAHDSRACQE